MRRLLSVVSLLLIVAAMPAPAQSATDRAIWIWSPPSAAALDFASDKGVGRVYQYVSTGTAATFGDFVADAHALGIEVYALNGDASWATSPSVVEAWVAEIAATGLFDGVIVDIEPYQLADWNDRRRRRKLLKSFVKGLDRGHAAAGSIPFVATVPFWYDSKSLGGKKRQLIDRVLNVVDGVNVLAQVLAAFVGYDGWAGLAIHHHDSYVTLR